MDHQKSPKCVVERENGACSRLLAFGWLVLIMGMFAAVESSSADIDCLRSIKNGFLDPQKRLSNWVFDNSSKTGDFICRFNGVTCWNNDGKVLNIRLRGMGLGGEFPVGLANCNSLTGLDLSDNHLYGSIPPDISKLLGYVTSLDLSYNAFSGEIPSGVANCTYLNVLKLNNNLLTGQIPPELAFLQRLKFFDVSNNLLSGSVPIFVNSTFPPESYANNPGLCDCSLGHRTSRKFWKHPFVGGFIAGWGISFILVLVFRFRKNAINFVKRKLKATPRHQPLSLSQRMHNSMISRLENFATRFSVLELRQITDNFSEKNVVANGEMGTIYKGILSNGVCLAIIRLWNAPHIEQVFLSEIMILGRLRHRNLVQLLGFGHDSNGRFLIYGFMPKGSLHDCLFSSKGEAQNMEWPVRAQIAVGIAKGISWLHQNRVVHHGINTKCILLDDNFNPRISDFGKAKNLNHNNWISGLSFDREFSDLYEEDVKAFGMVLLELITGTKYDEIVGSFDIDADMFEQTSYLLSVAGPQANPVQSMMEQGFGGEISRFSRAAGECLERDPSNRPSMEQVYQMLIGKRRDDPVDVSN